MAKSDIEFVTGHPNTDLTPAKKGTKIIKTGTNTGRFGAFVAREETTISAMQINGSSATLANYGLNSTTLYQGEQIWFAETETVTSITITGSLTAINR